MADGISTNASTGATSATIGIRQAIAEGGPLAKLFHESAAGEIAAVRRMLDNGWGRNAAQRVLAAQKISADARERVQTGNSNSPLAVLRECEAGCSSCCHTVEVEITPLEAIIVAEHLHSEFTAERLQPIRQRLSENAAARNRLTKQERQQVAMRCGLLDDNGLCSVYSVRPLVCAGIFSLCKASCQFAAKQTEGQTANQVAAQANGPKLLMNLTQVPLDTPARAWMMGVSGGLQRVLVEAGLDGNLYELNSIVLRALETPNVLQRWLSREDVFRGCICTDAHSAPRKKRQVLRIDPPQNPLLPHAQQAAGVRVTL